MTTINPGKRPKIVHTTDSNQPAFVSWNNKTQRGVAFAEYGNAINKIEPIHRSTGALANQYQNIDTNLSVKSPFSRYDYEFFRPNEQVPRLQKQIIATCMTAYDKVGPVRNIIDLMGDFGSQGIRLVHKNKSIEKFYQAWFKKVRGPERSERFLNNLYRSGNVIIKRSKAKIKQKDADLFKRGIASTDLDIVQDELVQKKEIPWRYTLLNPLLVDVVGEEIAAFTGKVFYKIKLPQKVVSMIQNPRDQFELGMINSIPQDILDIARDNRKEIKLGDDKVLVYFYKKDDWQVWANPMTYAILDDLITLEKMKLADLAALDGAISHIRIWKLGSLQHELFPTSAALQKLADLLLNNVGGGAMDLVWGPDLEIEETSTDIHKFLGNAKYDAVLTAIYAGMGVPPTLTGASQNGGYTNNFVSLKTLVERLRYGRSRLNDFWENEIEIVRKAMGFREPAQIVYDNLNLSEESSEKALWIRLAEEDIISYESIRERFGCLPNEIEQSRVNREFRNRKSGRMPEKAGPYTDAQPDLSMMKIFAQRGAITPGEAGLELEEREPGELSVLDIQSRQIQEKKKSGRSGEGRPKNSKDQVQRKRRTVLPSAKAEDTYLKEFIYLSAWAKSALQTISNLTVPFFESKFNTNIDEFSPAQQSEFNNFNLTVLCNFESFDDVNGDSIAEIVGDDLIVYDKVNADYENLKKQVKEQVEMTPENINMMQSYVYSLYYGSYGVKNPIQTRSN